MAGDLIAIKLQLYLRHLRTAYPMSIGFYWPQVVSNINWGSYPHWFKVCICKGILKVVVSYHFYPHLRTQHQLSTSAIPWISLVRICTWQDNFATGRPGAERTNYQPFHSPPTSRCASTCSATVIANRRTHKASPVNGRTVLTIQLLNWIIPPVGVEPTTYQFPDSPPVGDTQQSRHARPVSVLFANHNVPIWKAIRSAKHIDLNPWLGIMLAIIPVFRNVMMHCNHLLFDIKCLGHLPLHLFLWWMSRTNPTLAPSL